MKIFLTGGTGALGRPSLARLAAAGHDVTATVRSEEKAALVKRLGGEPIAIDLFDSGALARAVEGYDAVLHLATHIPPISQAVRKSAWTDNDRLRGEVTPVLADAARAGSCGALVSESITFMYPDGGSNWITEDVAWPPPHPRFASTHRLEEATRSLDGTGARGVVLRFGLFYGPEVRSVDEALRYAHFRIAPAPGSPSSYIASIHTDDAASAVVAALEAPAGTYNVSDDEPVTRREYVDAFARSFGLGHMLLPPRWLMRALGGPAADILTRSHRISNARFREATGWAPVHRDVRAGWESVAKARGGDGS